MSSTAISAVPEQEHAEVERQADQRQLAVHSENENPADRARQDRRESAGEHQREHQGDIAERHRVGAAPEMDVDHEPLGRREPDHERPERHVDRRDDRRHIAGAGSEQKRPRRDRGRAQRPDGHLPGGHPVRA